MKNVIRYLQRLGYKWEDIRERYVVRRPVSIEKLIRLNQPSKKRGIGFTRKNKSKSRKARKQAYKSRKTNR